jgi:hypothetical protein
MMEIIWHEKHSGFVKFSSVTLRGPIPMMDRLTHNFERGRHHGEEFHNGKDFSLASTIARGKFILIPFHNIVQVGYLLWFSIHQRQENVVPFVVFPLPISWQSLIELYFAFRNVIPGPQAPFVAPVRATDSF